MLQLNLYTEESFFFLNITPFLETCIYNIVLYALINYVLGGFIVVEEWALDPLS